MKTHTHTAMSAPSSLDCPRPLLAGKAGIYCIKHLATGKPYIGRSTDLERRRIQHWSDSHNAELRRMIAEHGADAFSFEVLEFCDASKLSARETYWIKQFKALKIGFNMQPARMEGVVNPAIRLSRERHIAKRVAANIVFPEIPGVDVLDAPEGNSASINGGYFTDQIELLVSATKMARDRHPLGSLYIAPVGATYSLFKRRGTAGKMSTTKPEFETQEAK